MPFDDDQDTLLSTESADHRSRLSQDCTEPGGGRKVLPRRIAGFSCRRQEICFSGLASREVRKSDAYAGAQAAFVEEAPEIFLPIPGGWGKDGTHAYSPGGGGRGCTDECTANGVETGGLI
jgi:hypothetical protein